MGIPLARMHAFTEVRKAALSCTWSDAALVRDQAKRIQLLFQRGADASSGDASEEAVAGGNSAASASHQVEAKHRLPGVGVVKKRIGGN